MNTKQELEIIKRWAPNFTIKEVTGEFVTHCPAKGYMTMNDWSLTYDQAIGGAYMLISELVFGVCRDIENGFKK